MTSWEPRPSSGPVTSLAFCGDILLAGIGRYLHVYIDNKPTKVHQILDYERIHFLKSLNHENDSSDLYACIGIKTFRIVKALPNGDITKISKLWKFKDRILDIRSLNQNEIAILFGFNNTIRLDLNDGELEKVQCQECAILYSGKILSNAWKEMVIASGSVFNQVLIWANQNERKSPVLHALKGHDGVIFSIDYLPEKRLLCSASDDRSIRIWTFISQEPNLYKAVRDGTFQPAVVMYGHTARIWNVRLLNDVVISTGEDATCYEWNYDGSVRRTVKFENVKSVRALAIDKSQELVATAGEDGGIQILHRNQDKSVLSYDLSLPELQDFPRDIKLLTCDTILIFTDFGRLYSYRSDIWNQILVDDNFRGYCVMAVDRQRSLVCLGSKNGSIKVCDLKELKFVDCDIHDQKVAPLLLVEVKGKLVLATTMREEERHWLMLYSIDEITLQVTKFRKFVLQNPRQSFINAMSYIREFNLLITGDKEGFVNVYNLENSSVQNLRTHRKGGISCFMMLKNQLLSAGRDGVLNTYEISENLKLISSNKPVKSVEWIHQLFMNRDEIFMSGFHSTSFQVWNLDRKQKLCDITCGGGHRLNDLVIDGNRTVFIYVRGAGVVVNEFSLASDQTVLREPIHGKEITSVAYLGSSKDEGGVRHFIASASEDTSCKIMSICDDNSFSVLTTFNSHISAVKSLHVSTNGKETLIFSCGGRGQLNVEKFSISTGNRRHMASHLNENSDLDIRYMCVKSIKATELNSKYADNFHFIFVACSDGCLRIFSLDQKQKLKLVAKSAEQNGCLMDICVEFVETMPVLITCSTSGQISFWGVYNTLLSAYLSSTERDNPNSKSKIFGSLDHSTEILLNSSHNIHRAGITSIAVRKLDYGYVLASVGEDNCLKITHLCLDFVLNHILVTVLDEKSQNQIHSSNVTGVIHLEDQLVTIGSDQRVVFWDLEAGRDLTVRPSQLVVSDVSDLLSCTGWVYDGGRYVMVGGLGLQIIVKKDSF